MNCIKITVFAKNFSCSLKREPSSFLHYDISNSQTAAEFDPLFPAGYDAVPMFLRTALDEACCALRFFPSENRNLPRQFLPAGLFGSISSRNRIKHKNSHSDANDCDCSLFHARPHGRSKLCENAGGELSFDAAQYDSAYEISLQEWIYAQDGNRCHDDL